MAKGTTKTGFEYEVSGALLNDAEFLETFGKVRKGDNMETFRLIEIALGKDQKEKLYDHVRDEEGHVPLDALTDEVSEIFTALGGQEDTKK